MSQLYRMSKLLAGISVEHGLDGLYQIALYERRHVVLSGKCNNDLERILSRDAVEQYTREFPLIVWRFRQRGPAAHIWSSV
jgi:hypothetical protein